MIGIQIGVEFGRKGAGLGDRGGRRMRINQRISGCEGENVCGYYIN